MSDLTRLLLAAFSHTCSENASRKQVKKKKKSLRNFCCETVAQIRKKCKVGAEKSMAAEKNGSQVLCEKTLGRHLQIAQAPHTKPHPGMLEHVIVLTHFKDFI